MNNQSYDAWDEVELSPEDTIEFHKTNEKKDAWDDLDFDEGFWKSALRTATQLPQGYAEATPYGILTGLWHAIAAGDIYDENEIEHIRNISEREGIPFDEQAYRKAGENALSAVPTISNIGSKAEELTGIPLEPRTGFQKGARFLSSATKLAPENYTFRGMNTSLPKPVLGAGVTVAKEGLQYAGVPEPVADIASFGILKQPSSNASSLSLGSKIKPSGIPERGFENLNKPREVSNKKLNQINDKLKSDFNSVSKKIVESSPVGETASNLANNPAYKQEARELLNESQQIADSIKKRVNADTYRNALADQSKKQKKGFTDSEYDKSYSKFLNEALEDIKTKDISASELVEQYRKNNDSLSEYFEPGSSKSLNRAKRDVILDKNRAIAQVIEKNFPESSLSEVFKTGNERWTKIMDAEAVDSFIDTIFKDGVNYKKMNDFFDKQGYEFKFKRALGDKGYKDFQQLLKDMLISERSYKMLKVAQQEGYKDLFKTGLSYAIHPKLGLTKFGYDTGKKFYKTLMNSLLDKPKLTLNWKKGISDLNSGNFKSAEKQFNILDSEIKESRFRENAKKIIESKKNTNPQNQK